MHRLGGFRDGLQNARVRTAATNIPLERLGDRSGIGTGIRLQQPDAAHDHARGAVRALERARVKESLLYRMEEAVFFEALDGGDGLRGGSAKRYLAGAARRRAEQHCAGAALSFAAAVLGSSEAELVAKDRKERRIRIVVRGVAMSVDGELDGHDALDGRRAGLDRNSLLA
jgi:hypothetical protein